MNKVLKLMAVATLLLSLASCNDDSIFSGYDKMESGAYMKFYERNAKGDMPRVGDVVTIEMTQYFNDTMLFTTVATSRWNWRLKRVILLVMCRMPYA